MKQPTRTHAHHVHGKHKTEKVSVRKLYERMVVILYIDVVVIIIFYLTLTVFVWPGNCYMLYIGFGGQFILNV